MDVSMFVFQRGDPDRRVCVQRQVPGPLAALPATVTGTTGGQQGIFQPHWVGPSHWILIILDGDHDGIFASLTHEWQYLAVCVGVVKAVNTLVFEG